MESGYGREPQETSEDREEGTPQGRLLGDEPHPDDSDDRQERDVDAPQEGGADSPANAAREGG